MPAAVMAASFENCSETGEIGVDICKWIDQRVSDTGLRREMNHVRKLVLLEQGGHSLAIGKVQLNETKPI